MANYYASARTNYFEVKDDEQFEKVMGSYSGVELSKKENKYTILSSDCNGAGWPSYQYDEESDEEIEIDLPAIVSAHLVEGEVAVFMECGAEKLRYLVGYAEAINSSGERESVSINDIYDVAMGLAGPSNEITRAEY